MKKQELLKLLQEFHSLGIAKQIDYKKFYMYSIITHSTAIEGSTVTETENQLMFDEGIVPTKRSLVEQMMNLDLKVAYEKAFNEYDFSKGITIADLTALSALVMKNTGTVYKSISGEFNSANGDFRLVNVSAGFGGASYLAFQKVPAAMEQFCKWFNAEFSKVPKNDVFECYSFSFDVHYRLVTIHPWVDGNGRMSRLVMNAVQNSFGLLPSIVYREHKDRYIDSLASSREKEDESIFIEFMTDELLYFLNETIAKFKKTTTVNLFEPIAENVPKTSSELPDNDRINDRINSDDDRLNDRINLSESEKQIFSEIEKNPFVKTAELVSLTGFSMPTVNRAVKSLREKGFVSREGSKKSGHWLVLAQNQENEK